MNKEDVVLICNGILLSHRKNKRMPFAAKWMQLELIILSEVRKRQIPYDITYMCNLKKTNEPKKRYRLLDIENKLMVAKGE